MTATMTERPRGMPPAALAGYSDTELAEFYLNCADDADEWRALLEQEMERRDQADAAARDQAAARARARAARQHEPVTTEWRDAAYSQYLQAERDLNGNLALTDAPFADAFALWSGTEAWAQKYATEELRNWWRDVSPRITVTAYRQQVCGQRKEHRNEVMDEDAARGVRAARAEVPASADRPADGARGRHEPGSEAADHRPAGSHEAARARDGAGQHHVLPGVRRRMLDAGVRMPVLPGGAMTITRTAEERAANSARIAAATRALLEGRARDATPAAPPVRVASEHDAARVITPTATHGASQSAVALREPGTVAGQLPDIDGAELLGHVRAYLARFARFPSRAALDAAVLWAAHTHARDSEGTMIWPATPRMMLLSRERGSGKTTVLELLARLVPVCHGIDVEPSMAGVTYSLGREKAVVAIDESDILWGAGKRKADLRAVLNAGYTRHGTVLRMRGSKGERVPVFGPVMLAGLDVVEQATGGHLDTLLSRAVIIRMSAPPVGEDLPDVNDPAQHAESAAERGRKLLAVWSVVNRDKLAAAQPEMPEGVRLRAAQIWRPLLAVAQIAGGDWPERAAAACTELSQARDTPSDQTAELLDELAQMTAGWD